MAKELSPEGMRDMLIRFFGLPPNPGTEDRAEWDAFVGQTVALMNRWIDRGDGIAVYRNEDFRHPDVGDLRFTSFGSAAAQLETDTPPEQMPDIGGRINWRFRLAGTYRGAALPGLLAA